MKISSFFMTLLIVSASITLPAHAKTLKVPKEMNGERVHWALWKKNTSGGSIRREIVSVRFRSKIKVPNEYKRSKTCFLNSAKKILACL